MQEQHYETDYSTKDKFLVSDENLRAFFVPALLKAGFGMSPLAADKEPFLFSNVQKQAWIDPMSAQNGQIRPPDVRTLGNTFVNIQGTDCQAVDFEIKDFPQMNTRLNTGIPFQLLRRYIAWQHLTRTPVFLIFRDSPQQEKGTERLKPYTSAYREGNEYVPYGGLIFDLLLMREESYQKQSNGKIEVLWQAQHDRDGKSPCMKKISEISELLASGKIRKVKGDPRDLELWRFIQGKVLAGFGKMMEIPYGGLIYFKTEN